MSEVTIFHNPACGKSRNWLALMLHVPQGPAFRKGDGEPVEDDGRRRV